MGTKTSSFVFRDCIHLVRVVLSDITACRLLQYVGGKRTLRELSFQDVNQEEIKIKMHLSLRY